MMKIVLSFACTAAAAFCLAACSDPVSTPGGITPPPGQTPAAIAGFGTTQIVASVGSTIDPPPGVIVYDGSSRPIAGVRVTFDVSAGGGSVSPAEGVTSNAGVVALKTWKLGPASGINTLVVRAGDARMTFTAFAVDTTEKLVARYKLVQVGNEAVPYESRYNDIGAVTGLEGTLDLFEGHFVRTFTFQWRYSDGARQILNVAGPYALGADGSVQFSFLNLAGTLRGDSLLVGPEKLPDDEVLSTVYVKQ